MRASPSGVIAAARDQFVVELPLPPNELSPNVRCHWSLKAHATREYRKTCGVLARQAKPRDWRGDSSVELDVTYRAFRGCGGFHAYDLANAMAALKPMPDGLVDAGVMPNDSRVWLTWGRFDLISTKRAAKGLAGVSIVVRKA